MIFTSACFVRSRVVHGRRHCPYVNMLRQSVACCLRSHVQYATTGQGFARTASKLKAARCQHLQASEPPRCRVCESLADIRLQLNSLEELQLMIKHLTRTWQPQKPPALRNAYHEAIQLAENMVEFAKSAARLRQLAGTASAASEMAGYQSASCMGGPAGASTCRQPSW